MGGGGGGGVLTTRSRLPGSGPYCYNGALDEKEGARYQSHFDIYNISMYII